MLGTMDRELGSEGSQVSDVCDLLSMGSVGGGRVPPALVFIG